MLLRSSSLSRALLERSLFYRYNMRLSGKRYEVPIVVITVTTLLLGLLVVMSGELVLSREPFIIIIRF